MSEEERRAARRRALRTARAITLGLAVGGALGGCEQASGAYCRVFEDTRYCCERSGGTWDAAASVCQHPYAMPGPFVPPEAA
jgi:hypothetical protein